MGDSEVLIKRSWVTGPVLWSSAILIVSQALTYGIALQEKGFVEANQITSPQVSAGPPLAYFFAAVVVMGVILFFVPTAKLKVVLRVLFALMFSWGIFIVLGFSAPVPVAYGVAIAGGLAWLFIPRVWLHDLLLTIALVSVAAVFGFLLAPLAAMSVMLVLSVYDVVAVRFGYMLWMAERLSESETLPAFIIPVRLSLWNLKLRAVAFPKVGDAAAERDFSLLGGGDIGFPLLLTVSVFFTGGLGDALLVSLFSLVGLVSAYWIQAVFLKGRPMPALPPISVACLVGFVIGYFN